MITVTGKTFEHRETLKRLGGEWNADDKCWEFRRSSKREISLIRELPGCFVTETETSPSRPARDDLSDVIAAILADKNGKGEEPEHGNREPAVYGDDPRYLNYFKDRNPFAFFGFSNLGAMCDYIDALPSARRHSDGWKQGDAEWSGTHRMSDALALARNGWQKGADNAAEVIDALNLAHATKRRRRLSMTGGHVSVGRMLAGNPVHMINRAKLPGRRIVTLFVEGTASAGIEAKNIVVRSAAIAAIADVLEREGYSCEITTLITVRNGRRPAAQLATTLKAAGERLNLNDVVFGLGHPSFLRRLHFACVGSSNECRSIWENQGYPSEAFNDQYPTGRNEFYIRHLTLLEQMQLKGSSLRERALEMLPFIEPTNLPIRISDNDYRHD